MAVAAEDAVNMVFRFTQESQHLVVGRGAVAVALGSRKRQQKPLLLAMGESGLLEEDGGRDGNFGLNQAGHQGLGAINSGQVPKIVQTGPDRSERRTQLDLSDKTHIPVILARLDPES